MGVPQWAVINCSTDLCCGNDKRCSMKFYSTADILYVDLLLKPKGIKAVAVNTKRYSLFPGGSNRS